MRPRSAASHVGMGRIDARIHVEHDGSLQTAAMNLVDPSAGEIGERRQVRIGGHDRAAKLEGSRRSKSSPWTLPSDSPAGFAMPSASKSV